MKALHALLLVIALGCIAAGLGVRLDFGGLAPPDDAGSIEPDDAAYDPEGVFAALAVLVERGAIVDSEHLWNTVDLLHESGVLDDKAAGRFEKAFPDLLETEQEMDQDVADTLRSL